MHKQVPIIAALFLVFFLIGCDTFIISPLIPSITADLHIAAGSGGYMVSAYSLFYVIFTFALGPLSDRIGRKPMIAIGMAVFAASSLITGIAGSFAVILAARCATGVGAAFAAPNIWAFIGDYFDQAIRAKVTAAVSSALSLGLIIGVPIGTLIEQRLDWQECFYLLAAFALAATIMILLLLPNSNDPQQTVAITAKEYRAILAQPQIIYSYITTFLINFANFGLYTFLGYWLHQQAQQQLQPHQTAMPVGIIFILAGIGNLTGVLLSGALSSKVPSKKLATAMTLILAVSFVALPLWRAHIALTIADIVIWMMAGGAAFSAMQSFVTQISHKARGTVLAMNNGFMWMGTAFGSAAVSIIIEHWNFPVAAYACACLAAFASFILKFKLKESTDIQ